MWLDIVYTISKSAMHCMFISFKVLKILNTFSQHISSGMMVSIFCSIHLTSKQTTILPCQFGEPYHSCIILFTSHYYTITTIILSAVMIVGL